MQHTDLEVRRVMIAGAEQESKGDVGAVQKESVWPSGRSVTLRRQPGRS